MYTHQSCSCHITFTALFKRQHSEFLSRYLFCLTDSSCYVINSLTSFAHIAFLSYICITFVGQTNPGLRQEFYNSLLDLLKTIVKILTTPITPDTRGPAGRQNPLHDQGSVMSSEPHVDNSSGGSLTNMALPTGIKVRSSYPTPQLVINNVNFGISEEEEDMDSSGDETPMIVQFESSKPAIIVSDERHFDQAGRHDELTVVPPSAQETHTRIYGKDLETEKPEDLDGYDDIANEGMILFRATPKGGGGRQESDNNLNSEGSSKSKVEYPSSPQQKQAPNNLDSPRTEEEEVTNRETTNNDFEQMPTNGAEPLGQTRDEVSLNPQSDVAKPPTSEELAPETGMFEAGLSPLSPGDNSDSSMAKGSDINPKFSGPLMQRYPRGDQDQLGSFHSEKSRALRSGAGKDLSENSHSEEMRGNASDPKESTATRGQSENYPGDIFSQHQVGAEDDDESPGDLHASSDVNARFDGQITDLQRVEGKRVEPGSEETAKNVKETSESDGLTETLAKENMVSLKDVGAEKKVVNQGNGDKFSENPGKETGSASQMADLSPRRSPPGAEIPGTYSTLSWELQNVNYPNQDDRSKNRQPEEKEGTVVSPGHTPEFRKGLNIEGPRRSPYGVHLARLRPRPDPPGPLFPWATDISQSPEGVPHLGRGESGQPRYPTNPQPQNVGPMPRGGAPMATSLPIPDGSHWTPSKNG